MASKIEAELLKASGEKPQGDNEQRQKYLGRLVRKSNGVGEKVWIKMAPETQAWVQDGVDQINDHKPITEFPDAEEAAPVTKRKVVAAPADDDDDDAPPATAVKKPVAAADPDDDDEDAPDPDEDDDDAETAPAVKTPAKKPAAAAPKEKTERKPGGTKVLRTLICQNPDWTKEKLNKALDEQGIEIGETTRNIVYYDTHSTLDILRELGKMTDDEAPAASAKAGKPAAKPAVDDDDDDEPPVTARKPAAPDDDDDDPPPASAKPAKKPAKKPAPPDDDDE
jgi:hypothetical protein